MSLHASLGFGHGPVGIRLIRVAFSCLIFLLTAGASCKSLSSKLVWQSLLRGRAHSFPNELEAYGSCAIGALGKSSQWCHRNKHMHGERSRATQRPHKCRCKRMALFLSIAVAARIQSELGVKARSAPDPTDHKGA
eukprot:4136702-Amphidinium_carterae.1